MPIIKSKIILLLATIFTFALGIIFILIEWNYSVKETSNQALNISKTSLVSFDLKNQTNDEIKENLYKVVDINKDIRFAYFFEKKDDKIYFIADSESPDSPDYSPSGQEFTEASKGCFQPFLDGKDLITKPTTDRWGTWISVFIPVRSKSGEIIAVFGIDYPVKVWNKNWVTSVSKNSIILAILMGLFFSINLIVNNNAKTKENEAKFRAFSASVKDAVIIKNEKNMVIFWNQIAEEMFGIPEKNILGKEFNEIDFSIADKLVELSFKKINGAEIVIEYSITNILINSREHKLAIIRDITDRKHNLEIVKKSEEITQRALNQSEKINKLMVGRELEMVKLKKEIERLKNL